MSNGISNDYYLPPASAIKVTDKQDNSALGKDAFLQILITQLQNQDPTSPMDDKEFISQMAQFSSLEQMQNMTKSIDNLLVSQQQSQLMNYSTFVGKEVKWHELTDKVDDKGKLIYNEGTGTIQELKFVDGEAVFVLADGKQIAPGNISSILNGSSATQTSPTLPTNPLTEASSLIGKSIQYKDGDQLITALIESIMSNNLDIKYMLNNGTQLTKNDFTVVESNGASSTEEETLTDANKTAE